MKSGFIAIITVLSLLVFSVSLSIAMTYLSISESQTVLDSLFGEQTLALSESCVEEALLKLRNDPSYTGESMSMLDGDCQVDVSTDASEATILAQALKNGYARSIRMTVGIDITGLQPHTWQEE